MSYSYPASPVWDAIVGMPVVTADSLDGRVPFKKMAGSIMLVVTLHMISSVSQRFCEVDVVIPILQMRNLRFREVKKYAQDCTVY